MDKSNYVTLNKRRTYSQTSLNTPNFYHVYPRVAGYIPPNKDHTIQMQETNHPYKYSPFGGGTTTNGMCPSLIGWVLTGEQAYPFGGFTTKRQPSMTQLHGALGNSLRNKLANTEVDIGMALAEFRETAELVVSAFKLVSSLYKSIAQPYSIHTAIRQYRRRKRRKNLQSRVASQAADAWLSFTFAVKPLLQTVADAITSLATKGDYLPVIDINNAWELYNINTSETKRSDNEIFTISCSGSVRGKARATVAIENPLTFVLGQLGLLNPFRLGWEILPFSFVIDWMVPIGSWLQNALDPAGTTFLSGYTYVKMSNGVCALSYTEIYPPDPPHKRVGSCRAIVKDRRAYTQWPKQVHLVPDFSLTIGQLTSSFALAYKLVGEKQGWLG